MANLITAAEVISNAFDREVATAKFSDNMIAGAQQKHIMPVLGEDFYDLVVATPASYTDLVAQIKPALAYFVKFYALPGIRNEIGTVGIAQITGQNRNTPSDQDIGMQQDAALSEANQLIDVLVKFLDDNDTDYPDYIKSVNKAEHIVIAGGIIFQDFDPKDDPDYDYTQFL